VRRAWADAVAVGLLARPVCRGRPRVTRSHRIPKSQWPRRGRKVEPPAPPEPTDTDRRFPRRPARCHCQRWQMPDPSLQRNGHGPLRLRPFGGFDRLPLPCSRRIRPWSEPDIPALLAQSSLAHVFCPPRICGGIVASSLRRLLLYARRYTAQRVRRVARHGLAWKRADGVW
jgi:hypothetical protein